MAKIGLAKEPERTVLEREAENVFSPPRYRDDFLPRDDFAALAAIVPPQYPEHIDEFRERIRRFGETVVDHLEALRAEYAELRESQGFNERQTRNARRANARLEVVLDKEGTVLPEQEDGHAELGITHGWTRQANRAVASHLFQSLFSRNQRCYAVRGRGKRAENALAEQLVTSILDEQIKAGQLADRMQLICRQVPANGTAILRYEMGLSHDLQRQADGSFREGALELRPIFTPWPLEDVYVSDLEKAEAGDQEGVFWVTRGATLADLERQEVVFDMDLGGVRQAGGKFRNLDKLREALASRPGAAETSEEPKPGSDGERTKATVLPSGTLIEYEGALPIYAWVKEGRLDHSIAKFFSAIVGEHPDPDNAEAVEGWARRLSRITHWKVSYLTEWTSRDGKGDNLLLQLEPDRHKRMRNTLAVFGFDPDGSKFYRNSIADVGRRLEDAADQTLNNEVWTAYYNANPAGVYDLKALQNKSVEEVERLIHTPGALIPSSGGPMGQLRVADVIELLKLPGDANWERRVAHLRFEFQNTVGASAAAQGTDTAPGTNTLGEIQINESKSNIQQNQIVLDNARELARVLSLVLEDTIFFLGPMEFLRWAERVTGIGASEIARVLPTIDGLEREIEITHPVMAVRDALSLAALLVQCYGVFGREVYPDPKRLAIAVMEGAGYSRAEDLTRAEGVREPEDEQRQMAQGNWCDPSPHEDIENHLATHLAAWRGLQARGPRTPEEQNLMALLPSHLEATVSLAEALAQIRQAMGEAPSVKGAARGPSVPSQAEGEGMRPTAGRARGRAGATAPGEQQAAQGGSTKRAERVGGMVEGSAAGQARSARPRAAQTMTAPGGAKEGAR